MIKTFISKTSMTLILEYAVCLRRPSPQYEAALTPQTPAPVRLFF
ncbi:hypothetical protein [Pseudomonas syringae]|nr:hypothetical protein [Pseudomonas syringae]